MKAIIRNTWLAGLLLLLAAPVMAQPVYDGLYVLDGYGIVHTLDNAPVVSNGINFGADVAEDIALTGNETGYVDGMYLLTSYGDVFSFGNAPYYPGQERPYWGWDIARDVEPAVDWRVKKNGQAGFFILDGYGGVYTVGDPSVSELKVYRTVSGVTVPGQDRYLYWGWDVAVDLEVSVIYDESAEAIRFNGYYILDKFGGVHWNIENEAGNVQMAPWASMPQPYFGWDIARSLELTKTGKGYFLLDGYGGVHTAGDAALAFPSPSGAGIAAVTTPSYFGWDIAKDIESVYDETGYIQGIALLDGYGQVHTMGNVPIVESLPPFNDGSGLWDIARDMEISPFYAYVTDSVVTGP